MLYRTGGIKALMSHKKTGFKGSVFTETQKQIIGKKLKEEQNGLSGFVELQHWIEEQFGKGFKYKTVYAYTRRHFGAKVKVARKSHAKKDKQAVEDFKKTSARSAKKSGKKKAHTMKK